MCTVLLFTSIFGIGVLAEEVTYSQSGNLAVSNPTKEQIKAKWQEIFYTTDIYSETPSVNAPYDAGALSDEYLESGETYLNYIRYIAKLPDIQLAAALNENAQYGAVLLAAIDTLTHYPSQPSDMSDEFYQQGYNATTSSNISMRGGYLDYECLISSIQGCMDDNGTNNLDALGHRRWLLNQRLLNVGFGQAEADSYSQYIVTKVFDRSGANINYDFVSWPASGNMPTNVFDNDVPWSVTLNPQKYQTPDINKVSVTIKEVSSGKTWSFDSTTGAPTYNTYAYMAVNNMGYGVANCIIFNPGASNVSSYKGVYEVTVNGIYLSDGTETSLSYKVDFFDIDEDISHTHSYQPTVTEPTCTSMGYTVYTCACGDYYISDYVNAKEHSYVTSVSEPTCTEEGFTVYICSVCGNNYISDYVDAKGHSYSAVVTAPTCMVQGYTTYTCSCGDTYVSDYVNATGNHTYSNSSDATCNVCGYTRVVAAKTTPMYRMYNPNSGEHFYTGSTEERAILVNAGWHYEGVAFNFPVVGAPVYRLYEPKTGEHLYTMDEAEKAKLLSEGWNYEGVAFNSAGEDEVAQYRLHNPNATCGAYHFTGSKEERDILINAGWEYQGIGWYSCLR